MRIHLPLIRFPWKIFSRVIVLQSITLLLFFLFAGLSTRWYFKDYFLSRLTACQSDMTPTHCFSDFYAALHHYDVALSFGFAGLGILITLFAILFARKLVFPIGRLLIKTKEALHPDDRLTPHTETIYSEAFDEEPSPEWTDLETSIEAIRRDLQNKIESLKVEREEQATLMSAISDAILAVDLEGAPLFYNSRTALLFGDKELASHPRLWEMMRNPEILDAFQQALRLGSSTSIKALPFDQPTGKRFFSLSVAPLRKEKKSIYGAVGIFHDVTDLKRAEQIRIDFVANVSHELRTPLTAIKGYTDTLREDIRIGLPPSLEFIEIITRNTERLMNLINDLLDLSSLESTDALLKSALNTEETTQRVIKQIMGNLERKDQSIQIINRTATVLADPTRLEQVLINLLDNANKYSPRGSQITITWEADRKNTLLKITNTGAGIPLEHHTRLFERFYRVDKARSREQGGTGLGLAIVKHILNGHDGSVWVESSPGQGTTTFICRFPN
jgi:two-component system phosphate regulon sensor histidine kinase PhoR